MSDAGLLVVGVRAADVRRRVGPLAWSALEVLATRARRVDGQPLADGSVRDLAAALGVATNTAHRAVRVLRNARLVTQTQPRDSDGRFVTGSYRLELPDEVLRRVTPLHTTAASIPSSARARRKTAAPSVGIQLDLLATD